ncbi:F-box and WD domain-containing protein [Podospora appendiculata]|uniref:F-box and WD domain-containing protein n=1 Tax=Podospora appendiculata TaxID=314037 RepID=A0AAE0X9L7_9PEZI|nr:F-box and WD domain-containing protein [Podospora appendiculata]
MISHYQSLAPPQPLPVGLPRRENPLPQHVTSPPRTQSPQTTALPVLNQPAPAIHPLQAIDTIDCAIEAAQSTCLAPQAPAPHFMHPGPTENYSIEDSQPNDTQPTTQPSSQHGFHRPQPPSPDDCSASSPRASPGSPASVRSGRGKPASPSPVDPNQLDQSLGRLKNARRPGQRSYAYGDALTPRQTNRHGQRIHDYENALAAQQTPKRSRTSSLKIVESLRPDGAQLIDFPNEILTHIFSHLHPESHRAVALVSKRFYRLVTTPYAWRKAFMRYFPEEGSLVSPDGASPGVRDDNDSDVIRSEARHFTRLTSQGTWRSEYLLRTRLLGSLARGKSSNPAKKRLVLTYNSKLSRTISNLHACFADKKKGPQAIHGAASVGVGTLSNPSKGRVEKWGLDDPFLFSQFDDVLPGLEPYGLGDGLAAVPNVMDVSQPYGLVGGEGYPGGRLRFRAVDKPKGRYLGQGLGAMTNLGPEIPRIPELDEAICSVWIAKSSNVLSVTQSMIGILAGSSLGVVTAYTTGNTSSAPRYESGDMTARWVLSPGVPIIEIKVDDNYNQRRNTLNRVWAVALNALGEVYYLTETPTVPTLRSTGDDAIKDAWRLGRTAHWELIEPTLRVARLDTAINGAYSPRSSPESLKLSQQQRVAEAQEIESFLLYRPAHFREHFSGWDMRRRLEIDFAGGFGRRYGTGESVFVITCGHQKSEPASVCRYVRTEVRVSGPVETMASAELGSETTAQTPCQSASIFGSAGITPTPGSADNTSGPQLKGSSSNSQLGTPPSEPTIPDGHAQEWRRTQYIWKGAGNSTEITVSAVDMSKFAVMSPFEDQLHVDAQAPMLDSSGSLEIPGRRGRLLAVGTSAGSIIVWNMRDSSSTVANPTAVIQTESPKVTSLALSAAYLIHGGNDGLAQAWDPLRSSLEPIRTLSGKSKTSGRIPHHLLDDFENGNYHAVRAIFLDPDPAVLRGILAVGYFIRSWTYSSTGDDPGRKRRGRHPASRRQGAGGLSSFINEEKAEYKKQKAGSVREFARLQARFGLGLDLTDEEALQYAEMMSKEAFMQDEQRRWGGGSDAASSTGSAGTIISEPDASFPPDWEASVDESDSGSIVSDIGSATDVNETLSAAGSAGTGSPQPSMATGNSLPVQAAPETVYQNGVANSSETLFSKPSDHAIELTLPEKDMILGRPQFVIGTKTKQSKKKKNSNNHNGAWSPVSSSASPTAAAGAASGFGIGSGLSNGVHEYLHPGVGISEEDDLALALALSLNEEENRQRGSKDAVAEEEGWEEYPHLLEGSSEGKGKGKERAMY